MKCQCSDEIVSGVLWVILLGWSELKEAPEAESTLNVSDGLAHANSFNSDK